MSMHRKYFFIAGNPVLHSMSPELFAAHVADISSGHLYTSALCADAADIKLLLDNGFSGCNITAPLKEEVLKLGFAKSQSVEKICAANTIWRSGDEFFLENTDIEGVDMALTRNMDVVRGQKAVVAGIGGAGRAAVVALQQLGLDVTIVNRSVDNAQYWAELLACNFASFTASEETLSYAQVFVSTIGNNFPFLDAIHKDLVVLDADYKNTALKEACKENGATYISGLQWLVFQAIPSFMYFLGSMVSEDVIAAAADNKTELQLSSIFLTGMMKTGKTTSGRLLAQKLEYDFADTDLLVEQLAGKTVDEIFKNQGEEIFRTYEKQVMDRLAGSKRMVIATGGGVVSDEQNRKIIRESGLGICLFASPSELASRGNGVKRPLLSVDNEELCLKQLLNSRFSDYLNCSQLVVPVERKDAEKVADIIYSELQTVFSVS